MARPALGGGVVLAAGASDDAGGEDGQLLVFDDVDLQAVLEREGLGDGQMEGGCAGRRRGRSCASSAAASKAAV